MCRKSGARQARYQACPPDRRTAGSGFAESSAVALVLAGAAQRVEVTAIVASKNIECPAGALLEADDQPAVASIVLLAIAGERCQARLQRRDIFIVSGHVDELLQTGFCWKPTRGEPGKALLLLGSMRIDAPGLRMSRAFEGLGIVGDERVVFGVEGGAQFRQGRQLSFEHGATVVG